MNETYSLHFSWNKKDLASLTRYAYKTIGPLNTFLMQWPTYAFYTCLVISLLTNLFAFCGGSIDIISGAVSYYFMAYISSAIRSRFRKPKKESKQAWYETPRSVYISQNGLVSHSWDGSRIDQWDGIHSIFRDKNRIYISVDEGKRVHILPRRAFFDKAEYNQLYGALQEYLNSKPINVQLPVPKSVPDIRFTFTDQDRKEAFKKQIAENRRVPRKVYPRVAISGLILAGLVYFIVNDWSAGNRQDVLIRLLPTALVVGIIIWSFLLTYSTDLRHKLYVMPGGITDLWISPTHLVFRRASTVLTYSWSRVKKIEVLDHYLFLYYDDEQMEIIPLRAFGTTVEADDFVSRLRGYYDQAILRTKSGSSDDSVWPPPPQRV